MKLYIANATRQIQDFVFRAAERASPQRQTIPIGGQIEVTGVDNPIAIDAVIDQHRQYGLISIDEVDRLRGPFAGLCYSIDKPVNTDKLHRAMNRRIETLEEQGKRQRQEAALATNSQIESQLQQNDDGGTGLRNFEMAVIEEEPRGGYKGDHKPIGEGIRVNRDEAPAPRPTRARGKKAA